MMNFAALRYEELSLNAFPILHTEVYDGWILRFSEGPARQGNCVIPLYLSTRSYEDKIPYCENKFAQRGLPCVFKMTANVSGALDQQLAMQGYEIADKTRIMECPLSNLASPLDLHSISGPVSDGVSANGAAKTCSITLSHSLREDWLEAYLSLDGFDGSLDPVSARTMLAAIRTPVYCAAVYEENRIVGCGLGVVEDGKIGLYDIRVQEGLRRKGIGAAICRAIMEDGLRNGADTAFLQVHAANRAAVSLYESLGFREVYTYWYRVKNQ